MDRTFLIRASSLYLPIAVALMLAAWRRPTRRQALGMLLGFLWCVVSLLALQVINLRFDFWSYHASGGLFRGMPVDLYLGWAVLWGVVPVLAFPRLSLWAVTAVMVTLDLIAMPLCAPVVALNRNWLLGEAIAVAIVLLPAITLARWTADQRYLPRRAAMLVVLSGGVFLFLLPEIIFTATGRGGWQVLFLQSEYLLGIELQLTALMALLGVSAVQEFAARGVGSPIPFDPPQRLVTSGVYRYVANPMQLSCVLVLLAWGLLVRNAFVASGAMVGVLYGLGIAGWDEGADLDARFGQGWRGYRAAVRSWRVRWKPWHDPAQPSARLYVAEACGPCSEVRRWIEARDPVGLVVLAAEDHPLRDLERVTYDAGDGSGDEQGIGAFARALEHLNLSWAFVGFILRLPGVRQFVQLLMDASGMGPQKIPRRTICHLDGGSSDDKVRVGDWEISTYFWEEIGHSEPSMARWLDRQMTRLS
jgi:protein-S-isoprenylcysteine O-methyltransferase Ste14